MDKIKERVVGYVRVSSLDQAKEGVSLDMQREKIQQYVTLNDMVLVDIIGDAGISAKDINGRPGFKAAFALVTSGQADSLVVWKLDRAFRSTRDALNVAEDLNKKGRGLHSITEKLDTRSAIGEFFFTLMASLAQMERKLVGERTKVALESKRARGERLGGQLPYGKMDVEGLLVDDPAEQRVIEMIKQHKMNGLSIRNIIARLKVDGVFSRNGGEFNPRLVHKLLSDHKKNDEKEKYESNNFG